MFEYKNFWEMDAPEDALFYDEWYIGSKYMKHKKGRPKKKKACKANNSAV